MIRRLPTGSDYDVVRRRFEEELEPLVGINGFQKLRVARSLRKIEESQEVRRRQYKHETIRGGVASFTSRSRSHDALDDPDLARAHNALGKQTFPVHGNYYWLPVSGRLERAIHVKVYSKDDHVGVSSVPVQRARFVIYYPASDTILADHPDMRSEITKVDAHLRDAALGPIRLERAAMFLDMEPQILSGSLNSTLGRQRY